MKINRKILVLFLIIITGSASSVFFIHWCNGKIELDSGLKDGVYLPGIIPETLIFGIFYSLMIILSAFFLAGFTRSLLAALVIAGLAFGIGIIANYLSTSMGQNICENFLDGFQYRVLSSGFEHEAVSWKNRMFEDFSKDTNSTGEKRLSLTDIPTNIVSLFGGGFQPEAMIYKGEGEEAPRIEVRVSNGADWGLLFVQNTNGFGNMVARPLPRSCGNGIYIFLNFYK